MTKETAKAIKQLIPIQDKALMMCSSINNAIALLKLYKNQIKRGLTPFYFLKIAEHNKPMCKLKVISIFEDTGVGLVHQRVT